MLEKIFGKLIILKNVTQNKNSSCSVKKNWIYKVYLINYKI